MKGLKGMDLAYIRYTGPYKGDAGDFDWAAEFENAR